MISGKCAMKDKLIVDTSAWIASFREAGNQKLKDFLADALDLDRVLMLGILRIALNSPLRT